MRGGRQPTAPQAAGQKFWGLGDRKQRGWWEPRSKGAQTLRPPPALRPPSVGSWASSSQVLCSSGPGPASVSSLKAPSLGPHPRAWRGKRDPGKLGLATQSHHRAPSHLASAAPTGLAVKPASRRVDSAGAGPVGRSRRCLAAAHPSVRDKAVIGRSRAPGAKSARTHQGRNSAR